MTGPGFSRRGFVAAAAASGAGCATPGARGRYDVIIRRGAVFDGSGAPEREADIGIVGDRIAAVGDLRFARGSDEIDAAGLAVTPGFINMLSWATESLLVDGRSKSDILQGCTLEVMGEGESMGPLTPAMREEMIAQQNDLRYDVSWTSLGEYLALLERQGVSCNVASLVGAATVRVHALGQNNVQPDAEQVRQMQELVRAAMGEGAMGVGAFLIYAPGSFAQTEELIALARVAQAYGGGFTAHIRSEADRYLEAIDELIEIAAASGARAQMHHIKPAGAANWAKSEAGLARMDAARGRGLDISANLYPYTAGATGLDASMPTWVQEGGTAAWLERLRNPEIRARVVTEMRGPPVGWESLYLAAGGAENVLLIGFRAEHLRGLTGMSLAAVSAQRGTSPEETIIDLLIENGDDIATAYFLMSEENIRRNVAWGHSMVGSDAGSIAAEGPFLRSSPHPRAYGTFARYLAKYVREERVAPLAAAIHRLTGMPARWLGLSDRGRIGRGFMADIAIFDPSSIQDHASFAQPHQYATGVSAVLVNGVAAVRDGAHTGALSGRFVKGPGFGRR